MKSSPMTVSGDELLSDSRSILNEQRYREAYESLKRHFPEAAELIRLMYNRGMVKGLRCMRYVNTPDGEWGRKS